MEEFRLKLIEFCNNCNLTIEELMFVVKDVYRDITDLHAKWIEQKKNAEAGNEISESEPPQE